MREDIVRKILDELGVEYEKTIPGFIIRGPIRETDIHIESKLYGYRELIIVTAVYMGLSEKDAKWVGDHNPDYEKELKKIIKHFLKKQKETYLQIQKREEEFREFVKKMFGRDARIRKWGSDTYHVNIGEAMIEFVDTGKEFKPVSVETTIKVENPSIDKIKRMLKSHMR